MSFPRTERDHKYLSGILTNFIALRDKLEKARKEKSECEEELRKEMSKFDELLASPQKYCRTKRYRLRLTLDRIELLTKKREVAIDKVKKYGYHHTRAAWSLRGAPVDNGMRQEDLYYVY